MRNLLMAILLLATVTMNAQSLYSITHFSLEDEEWTLATGMISADGVIVNVICNTIKFKVVVDVSTYLEGFTTDSVAYDLWEATLSYKSDLDIITLVRYDYGEDMYVFLVKYKDDVHKKSYFRAISLE